MRVPHTIPKNVCEAYRCSAQTIVLPRERFRTIRSEDPTWDESVIPELRVLALTILVERWRDNPIMDELPTFVDRDAILEILPIDLPLDLVVTKIYHDYYWSRIARHRWEYNNPEDHGNSWRRLYCERHLADYLENLDPGRYESEPEECENLIKLVQPYVCTLKIRSLVPSKFALKWTAAKEGEEINNEKDRENSGDIDDHCSIVEDTIVHHVPFALILPGLSEIREFGFNFGMIYTRDGFDWHDFRFSIEDCLGLGRAMKNCSKIEKFWITRSDLDQPRVAAVLQGIVQNNNIREIDFSHCTLGNSGAHAIGEFLRTHKGLRILSLVNNGIGAQGLAGIVHGLLQETATALKRLDLRLNPLGDDGGIHICAMLLRISSLEKLDVSGCGFGPETAVAIAEVVSSGYTKFTSMDIDLSNNDLGPIAGEALDAAMKTCVSIVGLDVRMCNVAKESECSINQSISRNVEERRKAKQVQSDAQRRTQERTEDSTKPSELESLLRPRKQSNSHVEPSSKSLHKQRDPTGAGETKSILKVGSRPIGMQETNDSTIKSSSTEMSIPNTR